MSRKTLAIGLIVLGMAVGKAGAAWAIAGPHGGYVALEDRCAGCHRAHTATGTRLLKEPGTIYNFCMNCHSGVGANNDVYNGVWLGWPSKPKLLGGGFEYFGGGATTSRHDASDSVIMAWGLGGANTGQSAPLASALNCVSCHNPHGTTLYRILRPVVNRVAVSVNPTDEGPMKSYISERYGYGGGATNNGFSGFCGACHTSYFGTTGSPTPKFSGSTPYTTGGVTRYRHRVDMQWNLADEGGMPSTITVGPNNPETTGFGGVAVSLADHTGTTADPTGGESNTVICLTCHFVHGTTASQDYYSRQASQNQSSSLLKVGNRGTCQACHQKS